MPFKAASNTSQLPGCGRQRQIPLEPVLHTPHDLLISHGDKAGALSFQQAAAIGSMVGGRSVGMGASEDLIKGQAGILIACISGACQVSPRSTCAGLRTYPANA